MAVFDSRAQAAPGPAGNLQLRFGLHNGPVLRVFYVVRNPRWLFGDTVGLAKKAWSNGIRNLIQTIH
jgi:hypothetical protein